ncbi:MAG: pyrroline-5-carboxylate reductase [Actinomycetota bacterium]|nr:pyrroline-5-carboxylate reductase [Actinomycetota bacterium]
MLTGLAFRPAHVVVSVLAGVSLEQLQEWTAPAGRQVRSIPLPTVSRGAGRTAVYPDDPVARALFESVGDVVVPRDEPALATWRTSSASWAGRCSGTPARSRTWPGST